jgi:hypothetical protein
MADPKCLSKVSVNSLFGTGISLARKTPAVLHVITSNASFDWRLANVSDFPNSPINKI